MNILKIIQQIISCFENGTPTLNYGYCEDIGDGRGYTCGIAGWTTANSDYQNIVHGYGPLAKFTSTSKFKLWLTGFVSAWKKAALDPAFCALQDTVQDSEYFQPAIQLGLNYGFKMPITQLILCDTAIQHGIDDDSDTSPGLKTMLAGSITIDDETDTMSRLLTTRQKVLESNGKVWQDSVGRVISLRDLLANNPNLATPFTIKPYYDPKNPDSSDIHTIGVE